MQNEKKNSVNLHLKVGYKHSSDLQINGSWVYTLALIRVVRSIQIGPDISFQIVYQSDQFRSVSNQTSPRVMTGYILTENWPIGPPPGVQSSNASHFQTFSILLNY
jgi:hypothetical protein